MKWPLIASFFPSAIKGHFCSLLKSNVIFVLSSLSLYLPGSSVFLRPMFGNASWRWSSCFLLFFFSHPALCQKYARACLYLSVSIRWSFAGTSWFWSSGFLFRRTQQKLRSALCQASHRRVGIRLHRTCLYFKIGSLTFSLDCTSCLWLYCSTLFSQFQ